MKNTINQKGVVVRIGELFLKGDNRDYFISFLQNNIEKCLKRYSNDYRIERSQGRFLIFFQHEDYYKIAKNISKIFGISSVSPVYFSNKKYDSIKETLRQLLKDNPHLNESVAFKFDSRRADKRYFKNSVELNNELGGIVHNEFKLKVNLTKPDIIIGLEIGYKFAFFYLDIIKGAGGLPVGTAGKCLLLLSGGIDSPVAGYLMQKRGVTLEAVYFHSPPYTGEGAKQKVIELARFLSINQEKINLHVVNFTQIQEQYRDIATSDYLVILYRRAMLRIAEKIADDVNTLALVTGESLGQVASQTLFNINCIGQVAKKLIFRPLIGFDKTDIVKLSIELGYYDTSIEPFNDCCSLFVPPHPQTKGNINKAETEESKVDLQTLIDEAFNSREIIEVKPTL